MRAKFKNPNAEAIQWFPGNPEVNVRFDVRNPDDGAWMMVAEEPMSLDAGDWIVVMDSATDEPLIYDDETFHKFFDLT